MATHCWRSFRLQQTTGMQILTESRRRRRRWRRKRRRKAVVRVENQEPLALPQTMAPRSTAAIAMHPMLLTDEEGGLEGIDLRSRIVAHLCMTSSSQSNTTFCQPPTPNGTMTHARARSCTCGDRTHGRQTASSGSISAQIPRLHWVSISVRSTRCKLHCTLFMAPISARSTRCKTEPL